MKQMVLSLERIKVEKSVKENYHFQVRKLSEQRNTVAHRAIGIVSAITEIYGNNEVVTIPSSTMKLMKEVTEEYNNLSEQMKHTDLLIDLAGQKMDEA